MTKKKKTSTGHERCRSSAAGDGSTWFPRVVSSYALAESAHWSRRLDGDVKFGMAGAPRRVAGREPDRDFYGREDADAAYLKRKPISFAVFCKPGLPDGRLADMLSAYWGCVHVSVVAGLTAGRAGARTASALRRGNAVKGARTAAELNAVLGLGDSEIRERGYVLTGFPRHDPEFSACAQIDAVFSANPPDVLIYMSCPNQDLDTYHDGLILELTEHDRLKQTLHFDKELSRNNHGYVRWYKSPKHRIIVQLCLDAYEQYSIKAVEEIIKQFDSEFVITVDGRRPVNMIFDTIKAKLMAMHIQRTVLPKIIVDRDEPVLSERYTHRPELEKFDEMDEIDEYNRLESTGTLVRNVLNEYGIDENDERKYRISVNERNEKIRLMSEFGKLCPVNFLYGLYKFGLENYCVQFMGKMYYFAGPEEMQLFRRFPKQFVEIPRPGLPIRAIFYGPETLSSTAANAVSSFFGYNVIDANDIIRVNKRNLKRIYSYEIVKSLLKNAIVINEIKKIQSGGDDTMRNAIRDWIRLYFENFVSESLNEEADDETSYEPAKEEELTRLRNYFDSYGIDFIDDFDACVRVYNEPMTLITHFQNMLKQNKRALRAYPLNKNGITQLELMDIVVDNVRTKNNEDKNWIVANPPLDIVLLKKLIAADLSPIQLVFFRDLDPMHEVLLDGNVSDDDRDRIVWEVSESVRNGTGNETTVGEQNYLEHVQKTNGASTNTLEEEHEYSDKELLLYDEYEIEDPFEYAGMNISNGRTMKIIAPNITERLDQYTASLLERWRTLKELVAYEMNRDYIDFNVIECKPDPETSVTTIRTLVEDTLYYIKKFLSDNVYDVSTTAADGHDATPDTGKYNGDTSVYCPVRYANGKLSIGSKKHAAVYQNRYYYASSSDHLKTFMRNPRKYASFTSVRRSGPKPKVSLMCPFGAGNADSTIRPLLDSFDMILVDSHGIFVKNVLPADVPMLGEVYEEPTLKNVVDRYFIPENRDKEYVDGLRKYVDRESDCHLRYGNWEKMNSIFSRVDEGICYKNYPRNVTELEYLKKYGMNPDFIVELTAAADGRMENARKAVIGNWSNYQKTLIDRTVARDYVNRRDTVNNRAAMFKKKLTEVIRQQQMDRVKTRLRRLIQMIAAEKVYGRGAVEKLCDDDDDDDERAAVNGSGKRWRTTETDPSDFPSLCSVLNARRKMIIVDYGLSVDDLSKLEDFATLDRIDRTVKEEFPERREFAVSECFSDSLTFPSDAMIERCVDAENTALANMRDYAGSSGVPWITAEHDSAESTTAALQTVAGLLRELCSDDVLETTFDVDLDASEDMLSAGEVYLSRYGRRCPVRATRRPDSVETFHADCAEGRVRPVVHRHYVYYLSGAENRDEFVRRPLEYALRPYSPAPNVPLRIAVVGPPNSGKSRCAQQLCDRHGFQLIRIERDVGPYLTAYWWTDDGKSAPFRLRRGDVLLDFTLVEIVKAAAQTSRAIVHGFVIDGFPNTVNQFRMMDGSGIMLHRVFVLNGRQLDGDASALSRHRREVWDETFVGERWLSKHYGNAFAVDGDDDVDAAVETCARSLRQYRADVLACRPARLAGVPVTKSERENKMTAYLDTCPVCRVDDDCSNRPREMADLRRGLMQYRSWFYWTCRKHGDAFASDPNKYADAAPDEPLPLAVLIDPDEYALPEHSLDAWCVVCALTRLWDPAYRRTNRSYAADYDRRTFAFCSAECLDEFVRRPLAYSRYRMRVAGCRDDGAPNVSETVIEQFPNFSYLEQTVDFSVSKALAELMAVRPVYPGLSADVSAMVFLGLYVGATNAVANDDVREYFSNAFQRFSAACNDFKTIAFRLKFMV